MIFFLHSQGAKLLIEKGESDGDIDSHFAVQGSVVAVIVLMVIGFTILTSQEV